MRVLVQVSCEIDPTLNVRFDRATGEPLADPGDTLYRVAPTGRAGIDVALSLPSAAITAFAVGEAGQEALYWALAAGARRAISLRGTPTLAAIAEWVRAEAPDVVIVERALCPLAGSLRWSHVAGVQSVSLEAGALVAIRGLGRGDRERVLAALPAVVRVDPALRPRYLARARIAAAREREIGIEILAGHDTASVERGPLHATRQRARIGAAPEKAPAATASGRLAALMGGAATPKRPTGAAPAAETAPSTDTLADSFVRYLAHHDLLEVR